MIAEKIQKEIDKKGGAVRNTYKTIFDYLLENEEETESFVDKVSVCCYDITVMFMEKILDNQSFYKEKLGLSQRNVSRIEKDLETMCLFEFPEELEELRKIEQSVVDGL